MDGNFFLTLFPPDPKKISSLPVRIIRLPQLNILTLFQSGSLFSLY
jgi:hypothetical protein